MFTFRISFLLLLHSVLSPCSPPAVIIVGMAGTFMLLHPSPTLIVGMVKTFLLLYPAATPAVGIAKSFLLLYPPPPLIVGMAKTCLLLYPPPTPLMGMASACLLLYPSPSLTHHTKQGARTIPFTLPVLYNFSSFRPVLPSPVRLQALHWWESP